MKKFFISLAIIAALSVCITLVFPENSFMLCLVNLIVAALYILSMPGNHKLKPAVQVLQQHSDKQELPAIIPTVRGREENTKSFNTATSVLSVPEQSKHAGIILRIKMLMDIDKLYQEAELTLHQLGTILQVPAYLVSQALNEGMNKNFYDLVNGYRVEEAKRLLLDTKSVNYTVLSVGFEAGFNSKTTFNTVFKKFTGLTPSEYRNKYRHLSIAA